MHVRKMCLKVKTVTLITTLTLHTVAFKYIEHLANISLKKTKGEAHPAGLIYQES